MTPQQLAALGEITRKAIADAVEPLAARIKEMEGRPVYDPQPHAEASAEVLRSIGQINARIDTVAKSTPSPYDEAGLVDRLAKQLEALREQIPTAYDDSALRQHVETVAKMASERPTPADGRDALQLEVLPAIDEQKSYTRGTYAKHAGGLWRAFEQTSGLRGWECIVNGVKSVDAVWHGRNLTHSIELSDGTIRSEVKHFPLMTYKNVFKPESAYEQGDTVTWAGSLWHCNVTGTKALPGDGSADWTLAVKKGRDGREVVSLPREKKPVQIGDQNA